MIIYSYIPVEKLQLVFSYYNFMFIILNFCLFVCVLQEYISRKIFALFACKNFKAIWHEYTRIDNTYRMYSL